MSGARHHLSAGLCAECWPRWLCCHWARELQSRPKRKREAPCANSSERRRRRRRRRRRQRQQRDKSSQRLVDWLQMFTLRVRQVRHQLSIQVNVVSAYTILLDRSISATACRDHLHADTYIAVPRQCRRNTASRNFLASDSSSTPSRQTATRSRGFTRSNHVRQASVMLT